MMKHLNIDFKERNIKVAQSFAHEETSINKNELKARIDDIYNNVFIFIIIYLLLLQGRDSFCETVFIKLLKER